MAKSIATEKVKKKKVITITNSKAAQTQLKTALRNHIDLSAIADQKANFMIGANSVIITIGLPILATYVYENPSLIIPTIFLALSSLCSIVFAILSTRPQKMTGETKMEQITALESNLFFFGNFYKMKFEDYDLGMKTVVGNQEIIDNSITRDLFNIGKTLGRKYTQLRICYNFFMYGVGIFLIGYAISFFLSN